jgi:dipeptidyl aminopeptidase/acylaminoacyl peptidase
MNRFQNLVSASLAALVLTAPAASQGASKKPTPPTIEQLAAFPMYSGFTVSPNGKFVAALEARGEDRVILIWPADNLKAQPTVLGSKEMKISRIQFIKDGLLAVTLWQPYDSRLNGVTKTFLSKLYIVDLQGKNWREPLPRPRAKTDLEDEIAAISVPQILDTLPADPDHILVISNDLSTNGDVYKVNLRSMRAEKIMRTEEKTAGYRTDLAGQIRARRRAAVDPSGAFIATEIKSPEGAWEEHFRSYVKDRDQVSVVGFSADPNIAYVLSNVGRDKSAIYEYDIAAKKLGNILFAHKFFNASGVTSLRHSTHPDVPTGTILKFEYEGPTENDWESASNFVDYLENGIRSALALKKTPTTFVDPATGDSATVDYDADAQISIIDFSDDLNTAIFAVQSPVKPPVFYMLRNGSLQSLASTYPQIDPAALGMTRLIYYKSRDGLDIPAFLTKPSTALCGEGPWPAVVHPHGGPWARDALGFDESMWVPLLSSRCYAVLQPQFRGSDGWGRRLNKEGDREWGGKMQDDKDDGARWMIDQKIAQPGRIAMFGFSYGGYAAMAAAVRPEGLYKCAISGAGVSDIRRIWSRFYTNPFYRGAQGPTVKGLSPLDQADAIKIPIMVYHGDRDRTVPIEQSDWFVDKAQKSGQPVVYHKIKDYGHGPAWTRQTMADQLGYIETYLKKDCGGSGL